MGEKKCPECKPGSPLWMSTFTDMNQLLLTFFILLLSMASMDQRKIKVALGSLQGSLGVLKEGSQTEYTKDDIMSRLSFVKNVQSMKNKLSENIKTYAQQANLQQNITVSESKKGVAVRIMDSALFAPGTADIKTEAYPLLDKFAAVISESPFNVVVEGHTDDLPITTAQYPTNWELSTARAVNVVKYFVNKGVDAQKLSASGYGSYHPVTPNISPESRAKNRRVEINFVSPELAESNKNLFDAEEEAQATQGGK
ncbi:OmpA family protein [Seleniivibrio sp.]|uniref:OmpA/MotB family protein n=1 Tax=Seleniivibrio sp. TaxID=2898801 RepID=UPI0025EA7D9C|nr:OmpA family protein [Seleniivibrio sp.]MCD8553680.1 OmpA family protein [Seleniivibrio sp.]